MSERIGRFEILSEIARSAAACVYKASDPESAQIVALKTARLEALGEQASGLVQRLLEEAEGTKVLSSHNIALLYGAGEIDGQFCASTEYVQGKSIATMLAANEGFSVWDLQDIARQACQALDHAHARKVVHYSLEPGKVMVSWDGTVKILGFGISALGAAAAEASGNPPETLHYMSPEQLRGEPLDGRSNLFSLGAILYEMVTDRKAFGSDDAEHVRQQILNAMPVPPALILPKIPPALSEVIMKALSKAPDQRYSSGKDLVCDLEQCKENSTKGLPAKAASTHGPAQSQLGKSSAEQKSVAAAAAWGGASQAATSRDSSGSESTRQISTPGLAKMSAAPAPAETELQPALLPALPPEDNANGDGPKRRSFSDITELPPLKEAYIAPAEPEAPEASVPSRPAQAPQATVFQDAERPKKAKLPAGEMAKLALQELWKTPPKLFLYSIAGAVLIILLVIGSIYSHIHSANSEGAGSEGQLSIPAATQDQDTESSAQPSAPARSTAVSQSSTPVEAMRESGAASPSVISVTPKYVKHKPGKTPPPAPAVIPGQLTVNSTPEGAQVLIDGHHDPTWVTPYIMTGLGPGQHLVSVNKLGYAPQTRTIDVASGSKSFLVVQLAAVGATLSVSTQPNGAEFFLDGKDTGRVTPVQMQVDHPGNHTLLVRKQGYLEETVTVNLQAGQTFQFTPELRALGVTDSIKIGGKFKKMFGGSETAGTAMVSVRTQPKGAQIAVNHHILDKGAPVEFFLNPGIYVIDITLSGYKSVQRVLNVDKNGKFTVDETLERQ
jgi:serine/threonine protein kinase